MLQETLLDYLLFYLRSPDIVPSFFLEAVAGPLSTEVLAAYDAPFPGPSFKAGLRQLTALIPLTRNDPGAAIGRATMAALQAWHRPFLTAYSDGDPATRGWETVFQERIPAERDRNTTRPSPVPAISSRSRRAMNSAGSSPHSLRARLDRRSS